MTTHSTGLSNAAFDTFLENASHITRSATLVVAASNSSARSKAQADYVCDGTADNVEIQAAITALSAVGGTVSLLAGNYVLSTSLIIINNNVIINGVGKATILSMTNGRNVAFIVAGNGVDTFYNILIQNLKIDGANQTATSDGIRFDTNVKNSKIINCEITNINNIGIIIQYGCNGCTIKDNKVDGIVTAIDVYQCGNTTVINNDCSSSGGRGIAIYPNETTLVPSYKTIISGNMVHNCPMYYGIYLYGTNQAIVSNNICYENKQGIMFNCASAYESCKHVIVSENYCYNNAENGILLGNTSYGYVQSCTIENNICEFNGYDGIQIDKSKYCSVLNNICANNTQNTGVGNRAGIYIRADNQYTQIKGNYCVDNQAVPTQKVGIYCNTGTDVVISNNTLKNNTVLQLSNNGTNTTIRDNYGYVTSKTGAGTITAGGTSVNVSHGLAATPTRIIISPTTDTAGKRYWISAKAASTFTITIDSAAASDILFDWQAIV